MALCITTIGVWAQGMLVVEWSKYGYTSAPGKFESITTDKWNNIITVGEYYGTQDFDCINR